MSCTRNDPVALMLVALAVVVWGFSWVVMKSMTQWIGAFDLVFWRSLIAFFVLLGLQLATGQAFEVPPLKPTLIVALLQTTGFQCLGQLALLAGGAGEVVLLAYTMPFWAAALAWPILGERLSGLHIAAFALAAIGLVLVISPWQGMGNVIALIPGVAAGLCWACGVVASKKMFQERPPAMLNFITWQMLLGSLFCLPLVLFVPQRPTEWSVELITGMAYLAIIATALGWWLWLTVVRRLSVAVVGMSSLGVPVLTVTLAWALLGEQPDGPTLAGVVSIIVGLVVVNLAGRPKKGLRT